MARHEPALRASFSAAARFTSAIQTNPPARTSSLAVAAPMPLAPPVTSAWRPSRRKGCEMPAGFISLIFAYVPAALIGLRHGVEVHTRGRADERYCLRGNGGRDWLCSTTTGCFRRMRERARLLAGYMPGLVRCRL